MAIPDDYPRGSRCRMSLFATRLSRPAYILLYTYRCASTGVDAPMRPGRDLSRSRLVGLAMTNCSPNGARLGLTSNPWRLCRDESRIISPEMPCLPFGLQPRPHVPCAISTLNHSWLCKIKFNGSRRFLVLLDSVLCWNFYSTMIQPKNWHFT